MADKTQMVIDYLPGEETRVAVVTEGKLEELHAERSIAAGFVGNIYTGKVMNVEPAIQAAFIDFGHGTNGFLHISDLHPQYFPGADDDETERIGKKTPRRDRPPIQQCLKRGQEILVQVIKEGISTKGPTLTSYLSIPGRYLVMLPFMDKVGVSRKVEDEDERKAIRKALDGVDLPEGFGFIGRTAAIGRNKTEIKRDLAFLQRLWKDIERSLKSGKGPRLLYAESDLLMRVLRDVWTSEIGEIVINHPSALRRAAAFMKIVSPRSSTKLLHYDRPSPIYHAFGIEEQIERIHAREVPLPSGGSLVIDETEAMICIDVNSGKMRNQGDAESTAFKTNREAVDEICRQLKLRDVGGLVLCDLIDMMRASNRRDIEGRIKDNMKRDRSATRVLPISQFGIVEITRQRTKGSMRSIHFTSCPHCAGRGLVRKPDSAADDAVRDLIAVLAHDKVAKVELVVSPRVASELLSTKRKTLGRVERRSGKTVEVRVSEQLAIDVFRLYAYDATGTDIDVSRLPKPKPPKDLPEWTEAVDLGTQWVDDDVADAEAEAAELAEETARENESLARLTGIGDGGPGEGEGDGAGKKKKRRRRRRRGKRGDGDGDGDGERDGASAGRAKPAPQRAAQEHDSWDVEPEEVGAGGNGRATAKGDSWDVEPEELTPPTNGARSRRRGGSKRGRKQDDTPRRAPVAEHDSWDAVPEEVTPAQNNASDRGDGQRGDSWDLDPSELPAAKAALKSESPEPGDSDDGGPKKKSRRRRGRGGSSRPDESDGNAQSDERKAEVKTKPATPRSTPEPAKKPEPAPPKTVMRGKRKVKVAPKDLQLDNVGPADGASSGSAGGGSKKKATRKRGRGRTSKSTSS